MRRITWTIQQDRELLAAHWNRVPQNQIRVDERLMDAKQRLKKLRAVLDAPLYSAHNHVHSNAERDALVCGLRYMNSGVFE